MKVDSQFNTTGGSEFQVRGPAVRQFIHLLLHRKGSTRYFFTFQKLFLLVNVECSVMLSFGETLFE